MSRHDAQQTLQYPLPQAFVRAVHRLFDLQGYLIIEDVLGPDEVARAKAALARLPLPERGDLRPLVDRDPVFLDHIDHPRILPYILALVGGTAQLMASCATVIPPGAGPMVWHEDGPRPWSYPSVGGQRALVMARVGIFLEDLSEPRRGNLVVVPGSHHVAFHRSGRPESIWKLPGTTAVCVRPGSAVVFHNGLWHSTSPNEMAQPRHALYYAYTPCWHRTVDYVTPPEPLLAMLEALPQGRRQLLRQLLGAVPKSGPAAFMFPEPDEFPGLALIEPEHPASGK
jgi:ectoine hydroxylase-related dioxygenase (phytanoyl-CoA dioxygenase family)